MSATTIKVSCPCCGDVIVTPLDMRLTIAMRQELSCYAFECPDCHDEVRKRADEEIVSLLLSVGVRFTRLVVPAEVSEARSGPSLTYDDLLDLALALAATDCLAARAAVPAA